jgi:hypothetical protein
MDDVRNFDVICELLVQVQSRQQLLAAGPPLLPWFLLAHCSCA